MFMGLIPIKDSDFFLAGPVACDMQNTFELNLNKEYLMKLHMKNYKVRIGRMGFNFTFLVFPLHQLVTAER